MTDVTQGADAPDDNALFQEAVTSLDSFENPKEAPRAEPSGEKPPADPPEKQPDRPTDKPTDQDAQVPAMRLREESEARRRLERERDELRGRLDALERMQRPQQQQQQEQPKADLFDNPSGFIRQEIGPVFEEFRSEMMRMRENFSLDNAIRSFGEEKVYAARQSLEQSMQRGDPNAWATYNRSMQSHDPYGVITRWHQERETLNSIGGDLDAYKSRMLEEAMKDPEFQKRVIEAAKGNGSASHVARPAQVSPKASVSPSLSNIGAGSTDTQVVEPSDAELFRAVTTAKRR
ncbi:MULTISPECIES: hypothetical protein [unclassified Bradyrhizobium]|uniref:hypothetical protein n=1 Tax=unclassified Bradyrhizobium TaxID=2631580 RepID=UPI002FF22CE6